MKTTNAILIGAALMLTASAPVSAQERSGDPQYKPRTWQEIAMLPDLFTGSWLGIDNMVDAPMALSFTPAAQKYIAASKPVADIRSAESGCKTPGMPFVMQIAAMPIKFMAEPGMIAIYLEEASQVRFLRMRRNHSEDVDPSFLGESIAHWEGETLVVDTVGLRPETTFQYSTRPIPKGEEGNFLKGVVFGPHGPNLRFVERMRLRDPNTLEIQTTTYDDTVFVQPKVVTRLYRRKTGTEGEPIEHVCDELNQFFDPTTNEHVIEDPAAALKTLEERDRTR